MRSPDKALISFVVKDVMFVRQHDRRSRPGFTKATLSRIATIRDNAKKAIRADDVTIRSRRKHWIFQSDNGGPGGDSHDELASNGGLRGVKGMIQQGGLRVPLVMRRPAKIHATSRLKAGSNTDMIVRTWPANWNHFF